MKHVSEEVKVFYTTYIKLIYGYIHNNYEL